MAGRDEAGGGAERRRLGSVGREKVAERVRAAMADEGLRRKAGEVGESARRAVEVGGSSYVAVGALLNDVRRRRRHGG